ncbi:MAG: hypothetical protein Q9168_008258, partial [Polycauliona sp. 1 TL-2023]
MIIRQALIRHGRRIATRQRLPPVRSFASEVDIESIEASLDSSLKETHSIESLLQNESSDVVPRIDNATHTTPDYNNDQVAQNFHSLKRQ